MAGHQYWVHTQEDTHRQRPAERSGEMEQDQAGLSNIRRDGAGPSKALPEQQRDQDQGPSQALPIPVRPYHGERVTFCPRIATLDPTLSDGTQPARNTISFSLFQN